MASVIGFRSSALPVPVMLVLNSERVLLRLLCWCLVTELLLKQLALQGLLRLLCWCLVTELLLKRVALCGLL